MAFEQDYNKLIAFASARIREYDNLNNFLAADAVNEAYCLFVESKEKYLISTIERLIRKVILNEARLAPLIYGESISTITPYADIEKERTCCTCKETKPLSAFPFVNSKNHQRKVVRNTCKECISKQVMESMKKNKSHYNKYRNQYGKEKRKKDNLTKELGADKFLLQNMMLARSIIDENRTRRRSE